MHLASDSIDIKNTKTPSAKALLEVRNKILREWEKAVRSRISAAAILETPLLIDTVPTMLDNLAEALAEEHPRHLATEASSVAQEHGSERARLSRYRPDQLILEYQILRDVILDSLGSEVSLSEKDRNTVLKSIDQGVCDAMMTYYLVHNQIREQFIASLTHDLRNPLGAAKMSAELLSFDISEGDIFEKLDDIKSLVQRIIVNTTRVDRMIQDLLDTKVIQMGERLSLKISECDMAGIVKESIKDIDRTEKERIRFDGKPCSGFWDCEVIRRAFENLLSNALKYGTSNTPIKVRVTVEAERVAISVHNEGASIPIQEQERLFQPFRRAEAAMAGDKKGWGLGLALVRGAAESHGGSIGVDSSPEHGTTFTIDIPIDARPYIQTQIVGA